MEGGTTFHFVDAPPAEALERAKAAAGGQDVPALAQLRRHGPGLDEADRAQPSIDPGLVRHPLLAHEPPITVDDGRSRESGWARSDVWADRKQSPPEAVVESVG
jgi:hypothetical protein